MVHRKESRLGIEPQVFGKHACRRTLFVILGRGAKNRSAHIPGFYTGILHGGLQAMICDEIAGWTLVGMRDRIGLTSSLNIRYIRSLYLGREIVGEGQLISEQDGVSVVRVRLLQDGKAGCTTRASFMMADGDKMEEVLQGPLPDGWRPFFDGKQEA